MSPLDRKFFELHFGLNQGVVYVRAIRPRWAPRRTALSGYFDSVASAIAEIESIDGQCENIAVGINRLDRAVLSRGLNTLDDGKQRQPITATSTSDVVERIFLLVDCDPSRQKGISSTTEELAAALALAEEIRDVLRALGAPDPVLALSGNGYHLLYLISLPADDGRLIERVLKALAFRFSNGRVAVDTSVHDAARVVKVYGTTACKGESTAERPHRRSAVLELPDKLEVFSSELLLTVAAWLPAEPPRSKAQHATGDVKFDLGAFMARHGIECLREKPYGGGKCHILKVCPFNPEHNKGAAALFQFGNGALAFRCHHNSCASHDWSQLRTLLDGDVSERRNGPAMGTATDATEFACTDTGNAERMRQKFGDSVKWRVPSGDFLMWTGTHWTPEAEELALGVSKSVVRGIWNEVGPDTPNDRRQELLKWALRSEGEKQRRALLKLYPGEEGVRINDDALDTHPMLLACRNGTIDLETGKLREPNRRDLLTKCVPIDYDPAASCPLWDAFLLRVLPDESLRSFVMRMIGYLLTGAVLEQVMFILFGPGCNGKSTLLTAIASVLGVEHVMRAPHDFLVKTKQARHQVDMAAIQGKRLVICSEVARDAELDESFVKELTGGDGLRGKNHYESGFNFAPTHKIVLAANYLPRIQGSDLAIWRRIVVVPFSTTIDEGDVDKHLSERLRAEERGILASAVRGCLEWQRVGLAQPQAVRAAVETYRYGMDMIERFIQDRCVRGYGKSVGASELMAAFESFCESINRRPMPWPQVVEALRQRSITNRKTKSGNVYEGLALSEVAPAVGGTHGPQEGA